MPGRIHDALSPFFSLLGMLKKIRKNTLMPSTTGVWYHKADILIRGLIASRTQIKQDIIWDSMVFEFFGLYLPLQGNQLVYSYGE